MSEKKPRKKAKKQRRIAIATCFPNKYWTMCAAEMLSTIKAYWPEDIKIYIQLDEQPEDEFNALNNEIVGILGEERCFIAGAWDDDQKDFMERWKDHKPDSYMFDVVRFSHKIFCLEKCASAIKDDIDVLIWLDADVITKKPVTHKWLESVLPGENETCSYLGRPGLYSECGFVAYNLKAQGYDLLRRMKEYYIADVFKNWKDGWTDCHVLDRSLERAVENSAVITKNLSSHYEHGKSPIDVWPHTKLAEKMEHRKGMRKVTKEAVKQTTYDPKVVNAADLNIKTKNCLDHDKIKANVKENLSQIRAWASITRPTMKTLECGIQPIVICAAGPSLANHIEEIKQWQKDGAKIIAVKHAIDTLKAHKVTPWGVVLLDPRGHVEGFVQNPDPDPFYFVASMCDPAVIATLNKNKCKVVGYHALVNAGELDLMIPQDLPVSGGSATSTRSIGLFADMFGFKEFHLYGYDLCHYQKPDLTEMKDENPKYMEVSLGTHTHGNKYITRTFWTEGQFLAQSNELVSLYKERKDLNITIYGDGLAGWLYRNYKAYRKYQEEYNANLNKKRDGAPDLDQYVNASTRGSELSRGL